MCLQARVVMDALRTILAVFWTATRFDTEQGRDLDFVRIKIAAMQLVSFVQQIVEWLTK